MTADAKPDPAAAAEPSEPADQQESSTPTERPSTAHVRDLELYVPGLRVAMRRQRRHARRSGDQEQDQILSTALAEIDIQQAVCAQVIAADMGASVAAIGDGTWLERIIENWDEIYKIIQDIVKLFLELI